MRFEDLVINITKILGFILIAVAVALTFWDGFSLHISQILLYILGLLFSVGGFILNDGRAPTESELEEMRRKELDQLYFPGARRTYDKKFLKYEALHRLTDQVEGTGDFSEHKGH